MIKRNYFYKAYIKTAHGDKQQCGVVSLTSCLPDPSSVFRQIADGIVVEFNVPKEQIEFKAFNKV